VTSDNEIKKSKPFDLEERTFKYAKDVFSFINSCSKTPVNLEISGQLIRSAGSVGANYIEAREALSKKDFAMRVKICRKEAKESAYWLRLLEISDTSDEQQRQSLLAETGELLKIFSSIVEKVIERKVQI
jgi:four helix bundle protein